MAHESVGRLGEVVAELSRTTERLAGVTDPIERIELRDRLNDLRAEAAALRGDEPTRLSDEQLASAIGATRRSLDEIRSQRFDPSMVAGATGYGGGLDPLLTAQHNRRVDEAGGRAALEARLDALTRELARRA